MAECQRHRDRFSEYIDGMLAAQERRALEEHLAGCPACRRELDAWRRLVADVGGLPGPGAPDGFAERVLDRLGEAPSAAPGRLVSLLWHRALPVAAMILVVLGLTFAVNRPVAVERPSSEQLAMLRARAAPAEEASARTVGRAGAPASALMDGAVPLKDDGSRLMDSVYGTVLPPATRAAHEESAAAARQDSFEFRRAETERPMAQRALPAVGMALEKGGVGPEGTDRQRGVVAGPSRQPGPSGGPAAAQGALAQEQFFYQVAPAQALQQRVPPQQVLTLVADDQAALASQVVAVANSNGLAPGLSLGGTGGGGAVELYLSVPVDRYEGVLRQLSDLALPKRQALANTEAAKGPLFVGVLQDYEAYRNGRAERAGEQALPERVAAGHIAGPPEMTKALAGSGAAGGSSSVPAPALSQGRPAAPVPGASPATVAASYGVQHKEAATVLGTRAAAAEGESVTGEPWSMATGGGVAVAQQLNLVVRVVRPEGAQ